MANIERMLEYHKEHAQAQNQNSLFSLMSETGVVDVTLVPAPEVPLETRLAWEKELLGLYVSGHPLDQHKERMAKRSMNIDTLKQTLKPGMQGVIMGIVSDARVILTKGGDQMAFLKISDESGTLETVIFPKLYTVEKLNIAPDKVIAIKGRLNNRNGELSMVAEAVKAL